MDGSGLAGSEPSSDSRLSARAAPPSTVAEPGARSASMADAMRGRTHFRVTGRADGVDDDRGNSAGMVLLLVWVPHRNRWYLSSKDFKMRLPGAARTGAENPSSQASSASPDSSVADAVAAAGVAAAGVAAAGVAAAGVADTASEAALPLRPAGVPAAVAAEAAAAWVVAEAAGVAAEAAAVVLRRLSAGVAAAGVVEEPPPLAAAAAAAALGAPAGPGVATAGVPPDSRLRPAFLSLSRSSAAGSRAS